MAYARAAERVSRPGAVPLALAIAFGAIAVLSVAYFLFWALAFGGWLLFLLYIVVPTAVFVALGWAWYRFASARR